MSKKEKIALIIEIVIVIVLIVSIIFYRKSNDNGSNLDNVDLLDYITIEMGYSEYDSEIISNYQEYQKLVKYTEEQKRIYGTKYDFNIDKYNEDYFKDNSLAIINVVTGSGSNRLNAINMYIKDNILICNLDIDFADTDIVTTDINGELLLVEIDKAVKDYKIEF